MVSWIQWVQSLWQGTSTSSDASNEQAEEVQQPIPPRRRVRIYDDAAEPVYNPPSFEGRVDWDVDTESDASSMESQVARHRSIQRILSQKGLPPELLRRVDAFADEGYDLCVSRSFLGMYTNNANTRYLYTPPLASSLHHGCLLRVEVEMDSHDQGWSSEPNRSWLGTYQGSYTWWDLTLERPAQAAQSSAETGSDTEEDVPAWTEIHRQELCRNIHASDAFKVHTITLDTSSPIVQDAQPGDRLCVWVRTQFPGWINFARHASIRVRLAWSD